MEDKELVTAEKKSLGERIGQTIGGALKVGAVGTVIGGTVGAVALNGAAEAVGADAEALKEGADALKDLAAEGLNADNLTTAATELEQASEAAEVSNTIGSRGMGALTGAVPGAAAGATFGAGAGWANKIKMQRAQLQEAKIHNTGEEIGR